MPFASLFLFLSFLSIRIGLARFWNLGITGALQQALPVGIYYDAVSLLLPLVLSHLTGLTLRKRHHGWILGAFVLWLGNAANLLYARFFNARLDWYTITTHFSDLFAVRGIVFNLAFNLEFFASLLFLLFGIFCAVRAPIKRPPVTRARETASCLGLLLCFFVARQAITAFRIDSQFKSQSLGFWVFRDWLKEFSYGKAIQFADSCRLGAEEESRLGAILARYRNGQYNPSHKSESSLVYSFHENDETSRRYRQMLGLPVEGPLNVIVLFVESLRGYEFFNPEIGTELFPRMHDVFKKHGILFSEAYSPAYITVDGEFSALCSSLPNMGGPLGVYYRNPLLPVKCVQSFAKDLGYKTAYMNSYVAAFGNTKMFEDVHGTDLFLDGEFFIRQGVTGKIGDWGLADQPFLQASLKELERWSASHTPFFVNLLTISSHGPYRDVPQVALPEKILAFSSPPSDPQYVSMLKTFHYVDNALGDFFDRFFESPIAERTLVVLSSDHSVGFPAKIPLNSVQQKELRARIVLGIITKQMRFPRLVDSEVNQIDVAPTIASILGFKGEVAWLGQNLLTGKGSAWIQQNQNGLDFRISNTACYTLGEQSKLQCYKVSSDQDPLFSKTLTPTATPQGVSDFFYEVIMAQSKMILNGCAVHKIRH